MRDKRKKHICFWLILALIFSVVGTNIFGVTEAKAADTYSFKLVGGETVLDIPEAGKEVKAIIFGKITSENTKGTLESIDSLADLYKDEISFMYADLDGNDEETIKDFSDNYSDNIKFAYGNNEDVLWEMFDPEDSVELPIILFIHKSAVGLGYTDGYASADEMDNVLKYCLNVAYELDGMLDEPTETDLGYKDPDASDSSKDTKSSEIPGTENGVNKNTSTPGSVDDENDGKSKNADMTKLAHMEFTHETDKGSISKNISTHDYGWSNWSQVITSYLEKNNNGFTRIEAGSDSLIVEEYDKNFKQTNEKKIAFDSKIFGGYYKGEKYRYVVTGQENKSEESSVATVTLSVYDSSWNKIKKVELKDNNTYVPFEAGSLAMAEANGKLCIHTCHKMYKSSDGYNHQANLTFVLDVSGTDIKLIQQNYKVYNISIGYVSHSFNQFVKIEGDTLYRLDHGDSHPRSVVLIKSPVTAITSVDTKDVVSISGMSGNNYTGVNVGGFEIAGNNLISAGGSIDQNNTSSNQKNIYVTVTSKDLSSSKQIFITKYKESDNITTGNPFLIKNGNDELYVMWEESKKDDNNPLNVETVVKVAKINGSGSVIGNIYALYARLSDCKPLIDGNDIVWYVTDNSQPIFYQIDLDSIEECEYKGKVDISDCSIILEGDKYTENKTYIEPGVTVKYGNYELKKDIDYTLKYRDNYYPGTAKVEIGGKGFFVGNVDKEFILEEEKKNNGKEDPNNNLGDPNDNNNTPWEDDYPTDNDGYPWNMDPSGNDTYSGDKNSTDKDTYSGDKNPIGNNTYPWDENLSGNTEYPKNWGTDSGLYTGSDSGSYSGSNSGANYTENNSGKKPKSTYEPEDGYYDGIDVNTKPGGSYDEVYNNKISIKKKSGWIGAPYLKKKAYKFSMGVSAYTAVKCKKISGSKQLKVSKGGKITVKKNTKRGTYKIKVKISAKRTKYYRSAKKTVVVKMRVK